MNVRASVLLAATLVFSGSPVLAGDRAEDLIEAYRLLQQTEQAQTAKLLFRTRLILKPPIESLPGDKSANDLAGLKRLAENTARKSNCYQSPTTRCLLRLADEGIVEIEDRFDRNALLGNLAMAYARAGDDQNALNATNRLDDSLHRLETLSNIAVLQVLRGDKEVARATVQAAKSMEVVINPTSIRLFSSLIAFSISKYLTSSPQAQNQGFDSAIKFARKRKHPIPRAEHLRQVADALIKVKALDRADNVLREAMTVAAMGKQSESLNKGLIKTRVHLAVQNGRVGNFDTAFDIIRTLKSVEDREASLVEIATSAAKTGKFDRGVSTARKILYEPWRAQTFAKIVRFMAKDGKFVLATGLANRITEEVWKREALIDIIAAKSEHGDLPGAIALVTAIPNASYQLSALSLIAERAFKAPDAIRDKFLNRFSHASTRVDGLTDPHDRVTAYLVMAQVNELRGDEATAGEITGRALAMIQGTFPGRKNIANLMAFTTGSVVLPPATWQRMYRATSDVVAAEKDDGYRQRMYREFAKRLRLSKKFTEAVAQARRIKNPQYRALAYMQTARSMLKQPSK